MATSEASKVTHAGAFAGRLSAGTKPALIVIDAVKAYLDPDAPLYLGVHGLAAFDSIKRLCVAARKAGAPVILTAVEYDSQGRSGGLFFKKVPGLSSFIKGSPFAAFPPGLAADTDLIVVKQYASAFFGTPLASTLRAMAVDTVVLCGFSTSGCIRASAIDAIQLGFAPFVSRDGCADRGGGTHDANLFDISAKYGEVVGEAEATGILAAAR